MKDLYIYTFDDPNEGRDAVSKAMAEAGCYGPKLEKQWAGKSPHKDMIHKFMLWKQKLCTIKLTVCVTSGLGAWMADVLEAGDTADVKPPKIKDVDENVNWLNEDSLIGLLKKYGTDDLDTLIHRVYEASDNKEDWQSHVDVDVEDLNLDIDVVRRSEQVKAFAIQFIPKKNVDLW